MKKVISVLLALALALACTGVLAEQKEKLVLGYANYASDENGNMQLKAFKEYVDEWNAAGKQPALEYAVSNAEGSLEKQLSDVETLIQMGIDGVYLHSIDLVGIIPAVQQLLDANVKVLEARGVKYDGIVNYVAGNEAMMAEMGFSWYEKLMDENPDLVLNIGLIYGMASMTAQLERVDHCVELLQEKYPGRVNILADQFCDWDTQKAVECMENWLQKYDTMNCVIAAGAMMACGACSAVLAAGGDMDAWIFTTTDSTADVLYSINNGQVDMTVGIDAYECGWAAADILVKIVEGEFTDDFYSISPLVAIDQSNIGDWYTE